MHGRSVVSFLGFSSLVLLLLVAAPLQIHGQEPEGGNSAGVTAESNFRLLPRPRLRGREMAGLFKVIAFARPA